MTAGSVTGTFDGVVRIWDAATGQLRAVLASPRAESINAVAFSSNGSQFAAAASDGNIYIYGTATQDLLYELDGPSGYNENSVEFDPVNPNLVLTANQDGSAQV